MVGPQCCQPLLEICLPGIPLLKPVVSPRPEDDIDRSIIRAVFLSGPANIAWVRAISLREGDSSKAVRTPETFTAFEIAYRDEDEAIR
jgi:hypothetical protein